MNAFRLIMHREICLHTYAGKGADEQTDDRQSEIRREGERKEGREGERANNGSMKMVIIK